jgi:anti-sigma B factor antagonist
MTDREDLLSARRYRPAVEAAVVELSGEIDITTEDLLRAYLAPDIADETVKLLVCDLSGLRFMGCAGLTVLIETRMALNARGAVLRTVAVQPFLWLIMNLTDISDPLGLRQDIASALKD